jgi:hypothetical protein
MGCEASEACQPHVQPSITPFKVSKHKHLHRGFCFGSKTIQIYLEGSLLAPSPVPPIEEQSNE